MKIQITAKPQSDIAGYQNFLIENGNVDLSSVSENECEEILLGDSLNHLEYGQNGDILKIAVSRLRKGGIIKMFGLEPAVVCKSYISGNMNDSDFSRTINSVKSCICSKTLKESLELLGLKIQTIFIQGLAYDITAVR
jgi:hypothetical protein